MIVKINFEEYLQLQKDSLMLDFYETVTSEIGEGDDVEEFYETIFDEEGYNKAVKKLEKDLRKKFGVE